MSNHTNETRFQIQYRLKMDNKKRWNEIMKHQSKPKEDRIIEEYDLTDIVMPFLKG